jgi:hypothetical protein
MTEQNLPLFYKQVAPLSKQKHGSWHIRPPMDFAFAAQTNSIYIAAIEFNRIAHEYPIVFGRDRDGSIFPVALLGLQNNRNLFVDRDGNWQADYIPAYVRRYPFILAMTATGNGGSNFTVCVDEAYAGFSEDGEAGQALFDESGEESPLLRKSVDFLKEYQGHIQLTSQFCNNLAELEVLEDMRADVQLPDGKRHALGGFLCVSRERLKKLKQTKLAELCHSDQLELIYAHLLSLGNLERLLKRSKDPVTSP